MPDADARAEVQQALQRTAPLWLQGGEAAELAAHTVRAYLSNVLDHPTRLEYRRVKESGSAFKNRVACCPGALSVLAATGWSREQYPDAIYWVLKEVRELDLREVVRGARPWHCCRVEAEQRSRGGGRGGGGRSGDRDQVAARGRRGDAAPGARGGPRRQG